MNLKSLAQEAYRINRLRESKLGESNYDIYTLVEMLDDLAQHIAGSPSAFKTNATWSYYHKEVLEIRNLAKKLM